MRVAVAPFEQSPKKIIFFLKKLPTGSLDTVELRYVLYVQYRKVDCHEMKRPSEMAKFYCYGGGRLQKKCKFANSSIFCRYVQFTSVQYSGALLHIF